MKTVLAVPFVCLSLMLAPAAHATVTAQSGLAGAPVKTEYYRVRIEYTSSSDWTVLTPMNLDMVRSVKLVSTSGPISRYGAVAEKLWLVGTSGVVSPTNPVRMTVDVALDRAVSTQGLQLLLEKGVTNSVSVKVSRYTGPGSYSLLREIVHTGKVAGKTTNNPLNVLFSASSFAAFAPQAVYAPPIPKKALAFYYPWFTPIDWSLPEFTDRPLELYSTAKSTDVQKLVDRAMASGLTGFVSSWWGPNDRTTPRFQILLDSLANRNFEATLYYETLRGGQPLADASIISELTYALKTWGAHPKFIRWDNRPVIFIWATGRIPAERWKTILATVRQNAGPAYFIGMGCDSADMDVFDGMHDYTVNQAADVAAYEKRCGKKTVAHFMLSATQKRKIWVATAMPGYDDTAIVNRTTKLVVPRNNGAYYATTLSAAINSKPDWIVVTSWNEWAENTHVEFSANYGTQYQEMTRNYLGPWLAQ